MQPKNVAHRDAAPGRRDADGIRVAVGRTPRAGPDVPMKGQMPAMSINGQRVDGTVRSNPRSGDVAYLRKCIDQSDSNCTLGRWPREGVTDPGVEDDEPGVRVRHEESGNNARFSPS